MLVVGPCSSFPCPDSGLYSEVQSIALSRAPDVKEVLKVSEQATAQDQMSLGQWCLAGGLPRNPLEAVFNGWAALFIDPVADLPALQEVVDSLHAACVQKIGSRQRTLLLAQVAVGSHSPSAVLVW